MERKHARVLIAGGSIAGLALANMLEAAGIEFLVLEKYKNIAPDLGASIAILPNAARILDQLGVWARVEEIHNYKDVYTSMMGFNKDGKKNLQLDNAANHFRQRFGYQMIFIDRQQLVQILYDNIKDKSRILVDHGVTKVEHHDRGVRVTTRTGKTFSGELLVGADGIHSAVRKEMWDLASRHNPDTYSKAELDNVTTEWRCIFGISKPNSSFPEKATEQTQGEFQSYLTGIGPGGRIYWFMFEKLDKIVHGLYEKIPHYTEEDLKRVAHKHADDPILDSIRFRDLYESREIATLQALPEMTLSKWHFRRIVLIGDAAHKYNPISGQGGAQAIEDAAVLCNLLHAADGRKSSYSEDELDHIFAKYQDLRHDRVKELEIDGHQRQSLMARDGFVPRFFADYVMPIAGHDTMMDRFGAACLPAPKLDFVETPPRMRSLPFHDELRIASLSKEPKIVPALLTIAAVALTFIASKTMVPPPLDLARPDDFLGIGIQDTFTGIPAVDEVCKIIVLAFGKPVGWVDVGLTIQMVYLLFLLFPIFIVWHIEGHRAGSRWSSLSCPMICGIAMHILGIGVLMPIYCLLGIWSTRSAAYTNLTGARLPPAVARAILPATMIGFVLPTAALFLGRFLFISFLRNLPVLWQFAAVAVSALIWFFAKHFESLESRNRDPHYNYMLPAYSRDALPYLVRTYGVIFVLSFIIHSALIIAIAVSTDAGVTFSRIIFPDYNPITALSDGDEYYALFFTFLKWDSLWAVVGMVFWGSYNVYELRRRGLVTTEECLRAGATFLVAQPVVGPGAALIGLWYWREHKILPREVAKPEKREMGSEK